MQNTATRRAAGAVVALLAAASGVAAVSGPAAAAPTADQPGVVRLITGETVRLSSSDGTPTVSVAPGGAAASSAISLLRSGTTSYLVSTTGRRYLDVVLDRSLFDVGTTVRDTDSGRIDVTLTVDRNSQPDVPGLTVTSRSAMSWRGYLTPSGARQFGAALARQARTDARAHTTSRTLFGGVARVAAPSAVTPVTPNYPQLTLTVKVLDATGAPADFADVALVNVDDARKFRNFAPVVDGIAKISVPVGTYSGLVTLDDFSTSRSRSYWVPVEQVRVDATHTLMTFDARRATTRLAVHTPRPGGFVGSSVQWIRGTGDTEIGNGSFYFEDADIRVAPVAGVTKGRLDWITGWSLAGTPASGTPYTYDLSFHDHDRIPADQDRTVAASQLARLDSRYYSDLPSRPASSAHTPYYAVEGTIFGILNPLGAPAARTEYLYAPPDARWNSAYVPAVSDLDPFQGYTDDGLQIRPAGTRTAVDWLRGPLAPGIVVQTPGDDTFACGYCRTATSMALQLAPVTDTSPGHAGSLDVLDEQTDVARFRLYRDGTLISDRRNATGDVVTLPARRATYRALVTTARGLVGFATSSAASVDVRFASAATDGAAAPRDWTCPGGAATCTVLPILRATVPLPTDLSGTVAAGGRPMTFTVAHAPGAADPTVSGVSFAVTFDGGRTWRSVPVTVAGGHRYGVTVPSPSRYAGGSVGVRISARDAAGGSLVETVLDAYRVARG